MKKEQPLQCDICGKFISWNDFETGKARRYLITPDSEFTPEEYETLCRDHSEEWQSHLERMRDAGVTEY